MNNISSVALLNYLSSPAGIVAALQHRQQQLLQQTALDTTTAGSLFRSMEGSLPQLQQQPTPPTERPTEKHSHASIASSSTKVDRGKSPVLWVNGAPVPTKLNNLRLKKTDEAVKKEAARTATTMASAVVETSSHHHGPTKLDLLQAGLLAATDDYPVQFPLHYRPNPVTDVIVGLGDNNYALPRSHNLHFERLCECSVPSFQAAIALRHGASVKKIVQSILTAITVNNGSFVIPWGEGHNNSSAQGWREVCRNDAERFTLDALRQQNAAQKARTEALRQVAAACVSITAPPPPQLLPLQNDDRVTQGPMLRRVSPPDLQVPSPAALGETLAAAQEESSESTYAEEDESIDEFDRPRKQPRRSGGDDNTSALDALYLLSETAAKIDSLQSGVKDDSL
jgi:hypothetical protein